MIRLQVSVADTAVLLSSQAYGPGALLRWESSALSAGPYAEGGTVALVAGQSAYEIWDAAGTDATWYRTRISDAAATTYSAYSPLFQASPPSLVTPAQVMALVPTSLTADQVQDVIDREERALARIVTDLAGERTQAWYIGDPAAAGMWWDTASMRSADGSLPPTAFWLLSDRRGPLTLLRPTDAVSVTDNGVTVPDGDVRLVRQGTVVERASGAWNGPVVEVAYTPNDSLEVVRVVIELCRMTLTETGYQMEQIGDYRYAKHLRPAPGEVDPRRALIRSLMTHQPHGTMRVRTQGEDGRVGGVTS